MTHAASRFTWRLWTLSVAVAFCAGCHRAPIRHAVMSPVGSTNLPLAGGYCETQWGPLMAVETAMPPGNLLNDALTPPMDEAFDEALQAPFQTTRQAGDEVSRASGVFQPDPRLIHQADPRITVVTEQDLQVHVAPPKQSLPQESLSQESLSQESLSQESLRGQSFSQLIRSTKFPLHQVGHTTGSQIGSSEINTSKVQGETGRWSASIRQASYVESMIDLLHPESNRSSSEDVRR